MRVAAMKIEQPERRQYHVLRIPAQTENPGDQEQLRKGTRALISETIADRVAHEPDNNTIQPATERKTSS